MGKRNKNSFKVIKDPVHGSMQFSHEEIAWIMPFIDSDNFQRLRHIKQAGLCDWFFIGAVHTRFNHCLGCCYVASQIAKKLDLSDRDRQAVMLAALLHDIGHGPLSHTFEPIFHETCINHEMWTPYFIQEFNQADFLEKLKKGSSTLSVSSATLKLVERLIMHQEKEKSLLADIVSSQLDADRLDYLLRDSHFCGVDYGEYDFPWLLNCLSVVNYKGKNRLGIFENGIGGVEHYLLARRLMTRNVYQHQKKHSAENLLVHFLKYLSHGLERDQRFAEIKRKTLAQFIMRVNAFNDAVKKSSHKTKIIKAFLRDNFQHYKQLYDYDIFSMIRHCANLEGDHPAAEIARRLQQRQLPKTFRIDAKHYTQMKNTIAELKQKNNKIKDWQIQILNLPSSSYSGNRDPILINSSNNKVKKLHDQSLIINALSNQWEHISLVAIDQLLLDQPAIIKLRRKLEKIS
ncbi:MAG: HD domain-containing protein [Pseudomonadota bacterium]